MLTARTKTIERTGTGRQFPPSLASLSATKFSLQIYMELTVAESKVVRYFGFGRWTDFVVLRMREYQASDWLRKRFCFANVTSEI